MEQAKLLEVIKRLRKQHRFTHQEMGEKISLSKQAYARLEGGKNQSISLGEINRIAAVFQLTTIELLQKATPEGKAEKLLEESIELFREAQVKINEAEKLLNTERAKKEEKKHKA